MDASLSHEVRALQNPALGAVLLWRCTVGFQEGTATGEATPLPLLFLVLPIVLHGQSAELLAGTQERSGLRKFTEKFQTATQSKTDLLLGLAARANAMRKLSMDSLQLALARNLVLLDIEAAKAFPLVSTSPTTGIPRPIRALIRGAEKLGAWFSEVSLYEVSLLLQVDF